MINIRHRLRATTLLIGSSGIAAPALAQDANEPAPAPASNASTDAGTGSTPDATPGTGTTSPDKVADENVIVVTGSRIARPELQAAVPVAVVSNLRIEQNASSNIQDVVAQLPQVGQNISRTSSNFSNTGNGEATINLRNLGSQRTLVLINGRRTVGIPGTSATDVNNIPTDFVDRVEVVTGGASAVYGSEAIAGVVNFVLKDKFDGLRIRAQNGITSRGDDPHQFVSVLGGKSFADDRGHIILNASYDNDHGLPSRNRAYSAVDNPSRSSYAQQGLFSVDPFGGFSATNGNTYTFTPENQVKPYEGANVDGYNREQNRLLSVPVTRYSGNGLFNFHFSDAAVFYAEGEYTRTKSNAGLEPLAVANSGPGAALNFDGTPYAGIPITSPFVPEEIRDAAVANGLTTIAFRRRSNDIFSRSNKDDRDYYRGVIGLKGDFDVGFGSGWHYDAYYEHSQVRDHTRTGAIFAPNYGAALSNHVDPATGQVVCDDPAAVAAGCVPINIFGYNTVSPAAAAFLQTDPGPQYGGVKAGQKVTFDYLAHTKQDVGSATVSGNLFRLWGNPISIAFGAEYRRESSSEVFDPYTQAGLSSGNQISNTVGKFNVKEGFVELVAPIVQDRPGLYYLGLEGAGRYADYSTVGGVSSYKIGGEYAPVSDFRVRGAYAVATRAPNIGELFAAQSQTFPAVVDPCDQNSGGGDLAAGVDPGSLPGLSASCAAIPGVSNTVARRGAFYYTTSDIQTVDGLLGGNRNLKQETANTITAGAVFTPHMIRGFSLTVDYYHIKVKNAIGIIGQQVSVDECAATGNPIFCSNVIRSTDTGLITRVNGINLNTGSYLVSGTDLELAYEHNMHIGDTTGSWNVDIQWNHLLKQQQTPYPGGPVQKELGQADCYSCGRLGTGFRNKVFGSFTVSPGAFSLNYRVRYYAPVIDNLDADPEDQIHIPHYIYHDMQARFAFGEQRKFAFYAGVNNLTDKQPPVTGDTNQVTFPGTETVADTYDLFGRSFYAGVEVQF